MVFIKMGISVALKNLTNSILSWKVPASGIVISMFAFKNLTRSSLEDTVEIFENSQKSDPAKIFQVTDAKYILKTGQ